eukprot:GEMP01095484.1.p1 GENE.GEMP01095484.1~~GEMP01095484.1.p1  ORF type:complete len:233 (+),score=15.34 GEMP01095484.1:138-836(+)
MADFLRAAIAIKTWVSELLSGLAGSGKTQACLSMAVAACSNSTVYYIYTEGTFPLDRLNQMEPDSHRLENIYIEVASSIAQLYHVISVKLPQLAAALSEDTVSQRDPLALVIIDSIAAWFRGEEDLQFRTNTLFKMSSMLKRLSDQYNFTVVVTNHVSEIDNVLHPSLGEAVAACWAHAFSLWRTDRRAPPNDVPIKNFNQKAPFHRILRVERSVVVPMQMIEFHIGPEGIS